MSAVHEEYERRPRAVGLAAKFLVALGFGLGLFLLGGSAAHAADGPLRSLTHRVTGAAHEATSHVVAVSAPREAERTIRVLPRGDAELVTVAVQPRHVEVTAPALPAPVAPVRVEVPAVLPSLPSVDVATARVAAVPAVHHGPTAPRSAATHAVPARAAHAGVTSHPVHERAADHAAGHATPAPARAPDDAPAGGPAGDVPAGAAAATGLVLAVFGTLGRKVPSLGAHPVHTVDRRAPVAPAFEPSFTPD
jgi:hypothetical protein